MIKAPRKPSVLVADDDATTRALLGGMVAEMGYPSISVPDGHRAWEEFQNSAADIVIADWQMPGLDGLELCRRVREHAGERCFVMIVTSRDSNDDVPSALGAGVDDYMTKPISRTHLRARLLIAERRLALSKARAVAEHEAARLRWLAGIGQTVLTFQHEINNPLTALYGHLEMILTDADLSPDIEQEARCALTQAERIAAIVHHLATTEQHAVVEPIVGRPMLAGPSSPFLLSPTSALPRPFE